MRQAKTAMIIILIGLFIWYHLDSCNKRNRYETQVKELLSYKDSVTYYKDERGKMVAENKALRVSKDLIPLLEESNKQLKSKLKNYARVDHITNNQTLTSIDSIIIRLSDTIPCLDKKIHFGIDSSYYTIAGYIERTSITFSSITVPDSQLIIVGKKKVGFLRQREYTVEITHSNPYVNTVGLKSYTFTPNKKLTRKPIFWLGIGALGGFIIKSQLN